MFPHNKYEQALTKLGFGSKGSVTREELENKYIEYRNNNNDIDYNDEDSDNEDSDNDDNYDNDDITLYNKYSIFVDIANKLSNNKCVCLFISKLIKDEKYVSNARLMLEYAIIVRSAEKNKSRCDDKLKEMITNIDNGKVIHLICCQDTLKQNKLAGASSIS